MVIPKPKQIVKSKAVLDSVAHLPCHHLGHSIYRSHLKAGVPPSLEHSSFPRRGFASTPEPLPRFEGQENCTFTIRVPRVFLTPLSREELTSRRAIWGTDVYTDDSDIITACIHSGWIRGEWPPGVDVSLLGLDVESSAAERNESLVNGTTKENDAEGQLRNGELKEKDILLTEPPPRGPMLPPENYDLHVTVLILPALEKYASTVRWGIKSRDWSATHDGLSFMILNIRWVAGDTAKEATGKARRMRMKVALEAEELNEERSWSTFVENGNGYRTDESLQDDVIMESYVRGDGAVPPALEISRLGTGSWWKEKERKKQKSAEKEPEPEVEVKGEERLCDDRPQGEAVVAS